MGTSAKTWLIAGGLLLAWAALFVSALLAFVDAEHWKWSGFLLFSLVDAGLFASVLKEAVHDQIYRRGSDHENKPG